MHILLRADSYHTERTTIKRVCLNRCYKFLYTLQESKKKKNRKKKISVVFFFPEVCFLKITLFYKKKKIVTKKQTNKQMKI